MLHASFQFDKTDERVQTVSMVSAPEEISRLGELQGRIFFVREGSRSPFLRRLLGKKVEISCPILMMTRDLLDGLINFLCGENAEFSLYGDDYSLRLQLRGHSVRLTQEPFALLLNPERSLPFRFPWSARKERASRVSVSVSLTECVDACLRGVAGLMIGMKTFNPRIEGLPSYQAIMLRHGKAQQALKDYREGKTAKNLTQGLLVQFHQIPKAQFGLACLVVALLIQSGFLLRMRGEVGRLRSEASENSAGASKTSSTAVPGAPPGAQQKTPAVPTVGKATTSNTLTPAAAISPIPGSEPRAGAPLFQGASPARIPPMPVQITALHGLPASSIASPFAPGAPRPHASPTAPATRASDTPPPKVYALRLIGVVEYDLETLALFEDGSDSFYKRPGDMVDFRDGSRWRLLSVATDRAQLERVYDPTGKEKRLLASSSSAKPQKPAEPERIALILGK